MEEGNRGSLGFFKVEGMVIAPCSVKTFSAVANSYSHNLLMTAVDVMLKERKRLNLLGRENSSMKGIWS